MNQILYKCPLQNNNSNDFSVKKRAKVILYISIILIILSILVYFSIKYTLFKKQKISENLVSNFNIKTLYSDLPDNYSSAQINTENFETPFVIGLIQIDKINITYPILSTTSEELLKISPCRFYGPMPNETGNLCIAGHNYINDTQFGKLDNLNIADIIKISDLYGNIIEYEVYDKKQIGADDLSCTKQDTNGLKEITLITCNNIKGNRVCVKARERM